MAVSMVAVRMGRKGRLDDCGQWEAIGEQDIRLWEQAGEILSTWNYSHQGMKATVECDFSSFVEAHKANADWIHAVKKNPELVVPLTESVMHASFEFFVRVVLECEKEESNLKSYSSYLVEKYLYDVFFIMNLSRPGVCDFLDVCVESGRGLETKLELSSDCFESAFRKCEKSLIPVQVIPLEQVVAWYQKLGMGLSQKADSGVEKAIFSILHICCGRDVDVAWVVWAFHALEAIYGTKVGEGFRNLVDRASVLLKLENKAKGFLKANLREMYDCRSAFVHGGYRVHHPMRNEVMDERLNEDFEKLLGVMQFGFDLILASLQALVRNDWYGITVEERISGVLPSDLE